MSELVQFRRYCAGLDPVKQENNKAAPAKEGWWAFPAGFERGADNVPSGTARRWHTFSIHASEFIYTGWSKDGVIMRDGFFNAGDWQYMTAEDAMAGFRRLSAWFRAYSLTNTTGWRGTPWRKLADPCNFQVFIPKGVRIR